MSKPSYQLVGRRIREERLRSRLTLSELAGAAGVSASYVSLVENAKAVPSLKVLDRICSRLSLHLTALFSDAEGREPRGFAVFRRRGQIQVDVSEERRLRLLLPRTPIPLEPVHLTLRAGGSGESFSAHKGVEFGYVIRGEVRFAVRDGGDATCRAGDSLIYDAMLPHSFVNAGAAEAELLLVGAPDLNFRNAF